MKLNSIFKKKRQKKSVRNKVEKEGENEREGEWKSLKKSKKMTDFAIVQKYDDLWQKFTKILGQII